MTNNQIKNQKSYNSPNRKESKDKTCCRYCENCFTIGMCLARLGVMGFSKRRTVSGKPDTTSFGINSTRTVHTVYAASSKYPGKQRTIARKNASQKSSSAKSLRYKNSRIGPTRRLQDKSDTSKARQGISPTIFTSLKRTTDLHSSRLQSGYSQCLSKRVRGERVCS